MKVEFPSSEAENIFNTFSQCPNCQANLLEVVSGEFPNVNLICKSSCFSFFEKFILYSF